MEENNVTSITPASAPARTIDTIRGEYAGLAAQSGQIQYQVYALSKDLEILNSRMRDLNLEAATSQAKEAKSNG